MTLVELLLDVPGRDPVELKEYGVLVADAEQFCCGLHEDSELERLIGLLPAEVLENSEVASEADEIDESPRRAPKPDKIYPPSPSSLVPAVDDADDVEEDVDLGAVGQPAGGVWIIVETPVEE